MSKSVLHSKRIEAFQLIIISASAVIIISLILLIAKGFNASYSVLLGGLIWLLPNFYFAYKVFSDLGVRPTPQQIVKRLYRAGIVKLSLSAIFFIAVIKVLPVSTLILLAGYGVAQIMFWLAPILLMLKSRIKTHD